MTLFLWKKSYEIDVPEIDVQHRRLVGLINELSDAMMQQEGYRTVSHVIDELIEYVVLHFSKEERLMREHDYLGLDDHHQIHLDLTGKVHEFKRQLDHDSQKVSAKVALPNCMT